jgi:orotidine-5'-phosphate decarboxylase
VLNTERNSRPIIIALDVGSRREASGLLAQLKGLAGMFKVGNELFVAEGPDVVRTIVANGERVFLDLKLHDIPSTVSKAALEAAGLGVSMLTIHASGGPEMIQSTRKALEDRYGDDRPALVAVTVLTSIDDETLSRTGVAGTSDDQVRRLALMAVEAGADGVVCSAAEIRRLRTDLGLKPTIVTPGVRMPTQSADDQKRIATPRAALDDGADWLVVGRYVNRAKEPKAALLDVIRSIE